MSIFRKNNLIKQDQDPGTRWLGYDPCAVDLKPFTSRLFKAGYLVFGYIFFQKGVVLLEPYTSESVATYLEYIDYCLQVIIVGYSVTMYAAIDKAQRV